MATEFKHLVSGYLQNHQTGNWIGQAVQNVHNIYLIVGYVIVKDADISAQLMSGDEGTVGSQLPINPTHTEIKYRLPNHGTRRGLPYDYIDLRLQLHVYGLSENSPLFIGFTHKHTRHHDCYFRMSK